MKVYPPGAIITLHAIGCVLTKAQQTNENQILWEVASFAPFLWKVKITPNSHITNNKLCEITYLSTNTGTIINGSTFDLGRFNKEYFLFHNYWLAYGYYMRVKKTRKAA